MRISTFAIALIGTSAACGQNVFVDVGACPGEGCRYGQTWVARESIPLRETKESAASVVATVRPGETVRTVTGEVHTVPGRFEVHREEGDFEPGDEVLVYTYLGEGVFRLLHNGKMKEADLGFSPWGGSTGTRCAVRERCWGSLAEELQFDWWVLVRTEDGTEGWTRLQRGTMRDEWSYGQ